MADEISKKVLIEIEIANDEAKAAVKSFKSDVDALKASTTALKEATARSKAEQANYTTEISKSKLEQQQAKTAMDKLRQAALEQAQAIKQAKQNVVAASGSYKEAQQRLTALGNAIKNTENGFKSSDPAIKQQIKDYNQLNNELKKFDAQMGNHQRNVGNYASAFKGISSQLTQLIPGFNQFSGVIQSASEGFSAMGVGAEGAEAATGALGATAIGLGAAFAGVAAIGVGLINYFKDIATFSDKMSNAWAGAGATWTALVQSIGDGDFKNLEKNMERARDRAKELNQAMIDLKRNMVVSEVEKNAEDQFIATQMLKMRNLHTTSAEAEKIFSQVQQTAEKQYKRVSKEAEQGYNVVANKIALSARLTKDELTVLAREGVAAAMEFKKADRKISDELIEEFAKFQEMRATAEGIKDQTEQRAQNREEQRIAKNEAAHQKALAEEQKEANMIEKIKQETEQANSERLASITRTLDFQRTAFAKELSDTDEHYRQLIFKQEQFIERQKAIIKSKKSTPKEKTAASMAIHAANGDISQLNKEKSAAAAKLLQDHAKVIQEETEKAANDLAQIQISSIDDVQERERQSNALQYKEKQQALKREVDQYKENVVKLQNEIKKASPERAKILQGELDHENELISIANDKKTELQLDYQKKEKERIKAAEDEKREILDQTAVLKAAHADKNNSTANDKALLAAEQKALLDKYNIDVSQKGLTDAKKLQLEQQFLNAQADLNDQYRQKQMQKALQWENLVQNAATQIIESAIRSNEEYQTASLNREKDHELSNTALTTTQKAVLNEKYRVLEGKAKQKAFKQEQALKIGEAIMAGAKAVVGDLLTPAKIPFDIATTAVEIATIAAQKPPAYAKGGLHYSSDGRGGVLPGYSKTDNTNAFLRSGEAVVVSEAMRDPWARGIVSAINQSYGGRPFDSTLPKTRWFTPGFASGGVFGSYLPTQDNGLRMTVPGNSTGRLHPDDIAGIANAVANIKFPDIITDIKDVNYEQGKITTVQDRANY